MPSIDSEPSTSTISPRESQALLLGSVFAALSSLLVTVLAARTLGPQEANEFVVFWGLLFGVYGVLTGIQQEVTRAVGAAHHKSVKKGSRVLPLALLFGLGASCLVLLLGLFEGSEIFALDTWSAFFIVACAAIFYSGQSAMMGAAAGSHRWYLLAVITGGDALLRFLLVGTVALSLAGLLPYYLAVALPVLLWVFLLASRQGREAARERADVEAGALAQKLGFAVVSSSANAVLVTGFPVILQFAVAEGGVNSKEGLLAAVVFAITITRAPIMMPLQAFQGVIISSFLKQEDRPLQALRGPFLGLLGLGVLGGLLAYFLGPWLFTLVFGSAYGDLLSGFFLGSLTLASAFMALLVVTGSATLAVNRHRAYTLGWVLAALVAILMVFIPVNLENRALLALYLGPLAGVAVHILALCLGGKGTAQASV